MTSWAESDRRAAQHQRAEILLEQLELHRGRPGRDPRVKARASRLPSIAWMTAPPAPTGRSATPGAPRSR